MLWLEKFHRFAIPGLTRGIAVLTVAVWIAAKFVPEYSDKLVLDPRSVLAGEWWRLLSFMFVPLVDDTYYFLRIEHSNAIWMVFFLIFLWFVGDVLEEEWGALRLTLFIAMGYAGTVASSFLTGSVGTFGYISMALFFAFATIAPNYRFLIFFIIPVPVKWLALISAALLTLLFIFGNLWIKLGLLLTFSNYLVFFGSHWIDRWRGPRAVDQRNRERQAKLMEAIAADAPSMYTCCVCGRTEITNPELEFRVSSADDREYCREHLPKS